MAKLAQVSFGSGEISPELHARVDLSRYAVGLRSCYNYFVRPTGGVSNRPGTRFVAATRYSDKTSVLIPFVYSEIQAYVLEFGDFYVRGYANGVQATVDLPTPYAEADLSLIRFTQSADVLTLVHPNYPPAELRRTSSTTFSYSEIQFTNGPFQEDNSAGIAITASGVTGSVTLTSDAPYFTSEMVGTIIRLDDTNLSAIAPWEPSKLIAGSGVNPYGQLRRANGKVYRLVAPNATAGTDGTYTGTVRPSHDEGVESDGDGNAIADLATNAGVSWQYVHSGFGIAYISAYTSSTTVTATVLNELPASVQTGGTDGWASAAWGGAQGYPSVVTYFGDRLVFANTPGSPQTQWASKVGDYHNFGVSSPVADDDAITQTLNARQVNAIRELVPLDQLISLTSTSSWATPRRGEVWTPATVGFDPQSNNGAAPIRSVLAGESAIFVQNNQTKVRDLKYSFDVDKFSGNELTVLARHLFSRTRTIVDMDYAEEPYGLLWAVRSDGILCGLTYLREQDVIAWHRHETDGFFERVCVIPEDGADVAYFVVRRTINGITRRYLERFASRDVEALSDYIFLDSSLSLDGRNTGVATLTVSGSTWEYNSFAFITASQDVFNGALPDEVRIRRTVDGETIEARFQITGGSGFQASAKVISDVPEALRGAPSTDWGFAYNTLSNLNHLEGKTVSALADGSEATDLVVVDGSVTLQEPAERVVVGLPYYSQIETLDLNIAGSTPIRDNTKVIPNFAVLVSDTVGVEAGTKEENLEQLPVREFEAYGVATQPRSEILRGTLTNRWNSEGRLLLRQSSPLPSTILGIYPQVKVGPST